MSLPPPIPSLRLHACNDAPVRPERACVLYWMIAARRTHSSFALQHAVRRAAELARPLVVLEALRADHEHATPRLQRFVKDGMRDNAARLAHAGITHHSYVEPTPGAARGLLECLAAQAALVITDEFPAYFLPRMVAAAARRLDVRVEQVDGNGLLPLRATERDFATAHSFRRVLQRTLPEHLDTFPEPDPLATRPAVVRGARLPAEVLARWPATALESAAGPGTHPGGARAGAQRLEAFLQTRLQRYATQRNHPDADAQSGLSPYLHFGHLGAHQVARRILEHAQWAPTKLSRDTSGSRTGWWGVEDNAQAFLDQLVTWRELGFVFAHHRPGDLTTFAGLPDWARRTLDAHRDDARPVLYTLEQLTEASTHDEVWNAAQRELVREGTVHNYLRMLWGKKILEWSESPEAALETMVYLNDHYALDGRDPNAYSGIGWVLGRFDRAWGPERPIFGTVRYMSSDSARRKLRLREYLARHAA